MADVKMIDKYKIIGVVGEGGMGKVYRAIHPTLKRDIIIKRLSISAKKVISERFRREARIMMDFHHESIVSVYDHFKYRSSYYIAMEFVDGISLDALIDQRKKIPPLAAALIFREICKGLKYAHDKGVIHRDIKPSNVLIAKNGEVKLFDFGIAMMEEDEEEKELTKTGIMMGTPSYMSPEQLADSKRVDKRSDIYSMGILFYQMLTGKRAYPGNFSADTIRRISKGVYEKPRKLVPGLPVFFEKLIKKMMHHKASKRYRDLDAVIHKIDHHLSRYRTQDEIHKSIKTFLNETAGKESAFEKIPRSKRARKGLWVAAAALLFICGAFVFFIGYTPVPGLYNEFFASRERGGIEVRVAVPADYYKSPDDVYAQAELVLFVPKTKESPAREETYTYRLRPVPGIVGFFTSLGAADKAEEVYLTSTPLYLPTGRYNLTLQVEQEKYAAAFYLNPLAVQKQRPDSPERRKIITFDLAAAAAEKITVV
ncbi:MAG TPA: serine/threonine protein kinase, partial [Spirochaetia bacterium]|nr:serine/threonine protein kinase [Spirochaetia bacterium]